MVFSVECWSMNWYLTLNRRLNRSMKWQLDSIVCHLTTNPPTEIEKISRLFYLVDEFYDKKRKLIRRTNKMKWSCCCRGEREGAINQIPLTRFVFQFGRTTLEECLVYFIEKLEKRKKKCSYLFTEMLIGFDVCWSVVVVLSEERESRRSGDDHRRLAAWTICWMISDGLLSLLTISSGSGWLRLWTGGNFGICGLISVGIPS